MKLKYTIENYQLKIKELNQNIEVFGDYNGYNSIIQARCQKCGKEWESKAGYLLAKHQCPRCEAKSRHRTEQEFIDELTIINPEITLIGNYRKNYERVLVRCNRCGHEWSPIAESLLRGSGCPAERLRKANDARRLKPEEFYMRMKKLLPKIEVKGKYFNRKSRMQCKCLECGYEWQTSADSLLSGSGCPKEAGNLKKSHDVFVEQVGIVDPTIKVLGQYMNCKTRIKCKCQNCQTIWEAIPSNLLNSEGCPICAREKRGKTQSKGTQQFKAEIAEINPYVEVVGEYINAHTPILCRCKICDTQWNPRPQDLQRGYRCPGCSRAQTSFTEQFILFSLREALPLDNVLSRDRKAIGSELDIYVPSRSFAIEFGSWHWHSTERAKNKDTEKRKKCKAKGIRLITIYDGYPLTDMPFEVDCYVFKLILSIERNHKKLKELVMKLLELMDISFEFTDVIWNSISKKAYLKSRKLTTDEFRELMKKTNPNVKVTGEYHSTKAKIECECGNCGNQWLDYPEQLLRGKECPKCTKEKKRAALRATHEHFLQKMKKQGDPNVEVLATYVDVYTPLPCRCVICGNEWEATPRRLYRGFGCPQQNCKKICG